MHDSMKDSVRKEGSNPRRKCLPQDVGKSQKQQENPKAPMGSLRRNNASLY